MSKIKSVEEVVPKLSVELSLQDKTRVHIGIKEDRQAFEEALCEALKEQKNGHIDHMPDCLVFYNIKKRCSCGATLNVKVNQALDQAIATVRAIYQGNK